MSPKNCSLAYDLGKISSEMEEDFEPELVLLKSDKRVQHTKKANAGQPNAIRISGSVTISF